MLQGANLIIKRLLLIAGLKLHKERAVVLRDVAVAGNTFSTVIPSETISSFLLYLPPSMDNVKPTSTFPAGTTTARCSPPDAGRFVLSPRACVKKLAPCYSAKNGTSSPTSTDWHGRSSPTSSSNISGRISVHPMTFLACAVVSGFSTRPTCHHRRARNPPILQRSGSVRVVDSSSLVTHIVAFSDGTGGSLSDLWPCRNEGKLRDMLLLSTLGFSSSCSFLIFVVEHEPGPLPRLPHAI
jgi:hypothetical protein